MKRAVSTILALVFVVSIAVTGNAYVLSAQSVDSAEVISASDTLIKSDGLPESGNGRVASSTVLKQTLGSIQKNILLALPESYDLRNQNRMTPSKDQGTSGSCWTFSAMGSLESCLMPGQKYDFSENNLKNNSGFDWDPNIDGGTDIMATAYFARWSGPVYESDDPYNEYSIRSKSTGPVRKHIQNVLWFPKRNSSTDNAAIKSAIMKYGAISGGMYMGGKDEAAISTDKTKTYYRSYSSEINHAVNIVGWDDSYSKNNFRDYDNNNAIPYGNGAFIVKNTYGKYWGENGYFYVSYCDKNFANDLNCVYYNAENTKNYSSIYQHDPLGYTEYYLPNTNWMANVFTAKTNDGYLSAVSFYSLQPSSTYNVYVCGNYTAKSDLEYKRVLMASGTLEESGYYTINLNALVRITQGRKFAVIVRLTSEDGTNIPIECAEKSYSSKAEASVGESFYSSGGITWKDLNYVDSTANVCMKAFTDYSPESDFTYTVSNSNAKITKYKGPGGAVAIPKTLGGHTVTVIGTNAFNGCTKLTAVSIPNGVKIIENFAFYGCDGLTAVSIPKSVTNIGNSAFASCNELTLAKFYGNAPQMGSDVFKNCASTFRVNYFIGKTGFTNPWKGYKTVGIFVYVKSVKLSRTSMTIRRGNTYRLTATISPINASNKNVTWRSGNRAIATVSSTGLVKGISRGTVYIYVYTVDGKKTAKCRVTVI